MFLSKRNGIYYIWYTYQNKRRGGLDSCNQEERCFEAPSGVS